MAAISAQKQLKKDTVLFAFLWCAIHPRQCSSNASEQLQNSKKNLTFERNNLVNKM